MMRKHQHDCWENNYQESDWKGKKTLTRLMEMVWALKLKGEKVDRGSVTEWTFQ